jgi:hypothetical protein
VYFVMTNQQYSQLQNIPIVRIIFDSPMFMFFYLLLFMWLWSRTLQEWSNSALTHSSHFASCTFSLIHSTLVYLGKPSCSLQFCCFQYSRQNNAAWSVGQGFSQVWSMGWCFVWWQQ